MGPTSVILCTLVLGQATEEPVPVRVSTAKTQSVAPRAYVPGTVVSPDDAQLAAETSGKLTWVSEPGVYVKAGASVARIDSARLRLAIESQDANTKSLEAMVGLRERDLARQRKLAESNAGIAAELDRASADLTMARQDFSRARSDLAQLQEELRRATLRAPFDGQIVERTLQTGEYAREGDPVVRIVNVSRVEIRARVPVRSANFVREGDVIPVRRGKQQAAARVLSIIQTGNVQVRSVTVRLQLTGEGEKWLLGSAVSVGVPTERAQTEVVVPRDAIVLRAGGAHVMVVDGDRAKRIGVELGVGDGAWIAVRGEVRAGQTVVAIGAEGLSDGDEVLIVGSPS
ncbi:MAG: efflux RND transporter periplasmic adaptor subunit [Myxococcota bacterium]